MAADPLKDVSDGAVSAVASPLSLASLLPSPPALASPLASPGPSPVPPVPSPAVADVLQDDATAWALAARDGDPTAAAAFIRATQAEVWRFVAAMVDPGSADDLTQETFLRALRALPAFEGRSTVRTWLFGIARRACADHIRATVRRRRLLTRAALIDPASDIAPDDPPSAITAAALLGRLSTDQREAFALTQVLGLSYQEAADALDVPIGTVRSRVARARAELIAALAQAESA